MKRIVLSLVLIVVLTSLMSLPLLAAENNPETEPALNQIQEELTATNTLTDTQVNRIKNQIQTQFNRMAKAGVPQEKMNAVANQACQIARTMAGNKGELSRLVNAVSFMSRECINGRDPQEVGDMIQQRLRDGSGINAAIRQTRDRLREQDRINASTQTKNSGGNIQNSGNGNGSSGKNVNGNSGSSGSSSGGGSGSGSGGGGNSGNGGGGKK